MTLFDVAELPRSEPQPSGPADEVGVSGEVDASPADTSAGTDELGGTDRTAGPGDVATLRTMAELVLG